MAKENLVWTLTHSDICTDTGIDPIPATVPGAVQLDVARAKNYPPYWYGENFRMYDWMEKKYWIYTTEATVPADPTSYVRLVFEGIDYRYTVRIGGQTVREGEGMFTPVVLDMSPYRGTRVPISVIIHPIPILPGVPKGRTQARDCCKPASSYGWDWHPRLVPSGLWQEAYLETLPSGSPTSLCCSYRLAEDLGTAYIHAEVGFWGEGALTLRLCDGDGKTVCEQTRTAHGGVEVFDLVLSSPALWFPRGYGAQNRYTLYALGEETFSRKIGFRRVKLLRNPQGDAPENKTFPMSRDPAPATFEVNGQRIFAKGTNWVNAEIFPSEMTDARYRELIDVAYSANINIFRVWGGGFINREPFYDLCDERGILVWQEFMLSCNCHPDDDAYLAVLEQEAVSIIRRLRTHPCLALWCGGNELFNDWSGMTDQSHPLRLLGALCYRHDRFTPFNMTSPLMGMGHGTYNNVVDPRPDGARRAGPLGARGEGEGEEGVEYLTVLSGCHNTAYTEFGCCGGADPDYIRRYIMDETDFADCREENPVWLEHHAFRAWTPTSWLRKPEVVYYFGGYDSVEDLLRKSQEIQAACYQTLFEEMRKQAPHCSMAINWDFNEPWPCAAGNSLVGWPCVEKPAVAAVRAALRPTLVSIRARRNRYRTGERVEAELWVLNDSPDALPPLTVRAYAKVGEDTVELGVFTAPAVPARTNLPFGNISLPVTEAFPTTFRLHLCAQEMPEADSVYTLFHPAHPAVDTHPAN